MYKHIFSYRLKINVSCLTKRGAGKLGELLTVKSLKRLGYVIHETNYRIGRDEFDVICLEPSEGRLIVYEVKTKVIRETGQLDALYSIDYMLGFHEKQLNRLNYKKLRAINVYGRALLANMGHDQVSIGFSSACIFGTKGESTASFECLISVALVDNVGQYL